MELLGIKKIAKKKKKRSGILEELISLFFL